MTTPPDSPSPDTSSRRFRLPVEYYSAPDEKPPLVSRGVAVGCGIAALTFLLVIFIAGAVVAHHGLGRFMDPLLGMMADEMGPMYTKDVTPDERKAVADEITHLRENVRSGKVPVAKLERVMGSIRTAIEDQKITPEEATRLTRELHDTNNPPPPQPGKK